MARLRQTKQETASYKPALKISGYSGKDSAIVRRRLLDTRGLGSDHYNSHPEDLQKLIRDVQL